MMEIEVTTESPGNTLCKACGLCCNGHLFGWTKLKSVELNTMEALGVRVLRSIPSQRGFNQPCPLWSGQCTIYTSSSYPHFCRSYKCKLLKSLLDETTPLGEALDMVNGAKGLIKDLEALLPDSANPNFRERMVARLDELENQNQVTREDEQEFRQKASELIGLYERVFGVEDL